MNQWIGSIAAAGLFLAGLVNAEDTTIVPDIGDPTPNCQGKVWWAESDARWDDFDFWLGEWLIFDPQSNRLVGMSHVERLPGHCGLRQEFRGMSDTPGGAVTPRMLGTSFSALAAGGRWHQVWVDNSGSFIQTSGELDSDGAMVLESDWLQFTDRQDRKIRMKYRFHWQQTEDGGLRAWGFQKYAQPKEVDWQQYYDLVQYRNGVGGPTLTRVEKEK